MKWVLAWVTAAVLAAAPVAAQEAATQAAPTQVYIVDTERLYTDSRFGRSLRGQIEDQITQLNIENERIVADLTAEEQDLARRRPDMDVAEFRAEAAAFDTKVQDIRQARDAKEAELQRAQSNARVTFYNQARPVVWQLMASRGGVAVIDSRSALVFLRNVDITDAAIEAIDKTLAPDAE